jgi:hypothetical protein
MVLAFPDDQRYSIPFSIGIGDSESGPRLGGRSPASVVSLRLIQGAYFATVPVVTTPALEASIFLDWKRFGAFDKVPRNCVSPAGTEFVEVVSAEPMRRRSDTVFAGPLSEHPLMLGTLTDDTEVDFDEQLCFRSSHKLGGSPHLIQPRESLVKQLETIRLNDYRHIVQFDYVVPNDAAWKGTWPFGDGLFNLFGKPPFQTGDWLWLWQY